MLTIVTATYNRGYTLSRLFESLMQQADKNFEWVVVDDGSTDDTASLLKSFVSKALFPIKVVEQENSGKHVAINSGVSVSSGQWIYLVDSDDALPEEAVSFFLDILANDIDVGVVGYCFRKQSFSGQIIGSISNGNPTDVMVMTPTEAGNYYKGDLAYIFNRSALVKHTFPVFEGEKFVPELFVWNKISDDGVLKFFGNKVLYLCEYLEDGYSANFSAMLRRNPLGFGLYYKHQIAREKSLIRKLKCSIRYAQCKLFSMNSGRKC